MKRYGATATRVLDTARRLFNEKGYAAATLTETAAIVGISQGNLTYHFPTKRDLALALEAQALEKARIRRANKQDGKIADDYVEHLLFAMDITWENRFLLQDRALFASTKDRSSNDSEFAADFDELYGLVLRIEAEGLMRKNLGTDLKQLARSLWIVSRYWMDYLREYEGLETISWADQERGIEQHFAVLMPCLTVAGRSEFLAALEQASKA